MALPVWIGLVALACAPPWAVYRDSPFEPNADPYADKTVIKMAVVVRTSHS